MPDLPVSSIQEIYCDATSVNTADNISFYFKCSYHPVYAKAKVHVDFSLHVIAKPVQPLGIWRCRVNFWLKEGVGELNEEQGFEYYKHGFRLAFSAAEKFVQTKYRVTSISIPLTDAELLKRYHDFLKKRSLELRT